MPEPKLDKAQKKRFDEFMEKHHTTTQVEPRILSEDEVEQHLAEELSIQKKEILKQMEAGLWLILVYTESERMSKEKAVKKVIKKINQEIKLK